MQNRVVNMRGENEEGLGRSVVFFFFFFFPSGREREEEKKGKEGKENTLLVPVDAR